MSILSRLAPPDGARTSERRVGRGPGSGKGKTCGRGNKGQKARNGGNIGKLHFQGGQTPIQRRLPKRGFRPLHPQLVVEINVSLLERFADGTVVTEELLRSTRLLQDRNAIVKILGEGALTKKLTVNADAFSAGARAKIEAAGGSAVVAGAEA